MTSLCGHVCKRLQNKDLQTEHSLISQHNSMTTGTK